MQNIKKNNRIYLSGGGDEKQSFPLDNFFFSSLPENGRFLYIPLALRGNNLYATSHLWMKGVVKLHKRADIQFETADDPARYRLDTLKEFNGIYIGGGNTWNLIRELRDSGFSDILIKYHKDGGQIYGGSAGAIIMGKRIDTHDDANKINYKNLSGFDLLHNFSVACHFKDNLGERFKIWAKDNDLPIICLSEETGLIVEKSIALCVGAKPCTIYFADGTKKEVRPEEFFNL